MKATLKQCSLCPPGVLRPLWKSNPPMCKTHSNILAAKKHIAEKKESGVSEKDTKFYEFVWKYRDHFCAECGAVLREMKRDYFHHILPKRNGAGGYPYFRYEEMNIILLCWSCHQKIENAIAAPKMKVFEFCEGIKKQLLENVGLPYSPKSSQEIKNRLTNFLNETS